MGTYDDFHPSEIGGYMEMETFRLPMLHEGAVALNCGRSALAYLIEARGIRKLALPYFLCDSQKNVCDRYGVQIRFYHVGMDFLPVDLRAEADEVLYLVNYYGQMPRDVLLGFVRENPRVIVDNTQAYFDAPIPGADTLCSCRKYFGVSDGAFLYTDARLDRPLPKDESFDRIRYVLGRYERDAGTFFRDSQANNDFFDGEPIREMSRLTRNLLHAVDYEDVCARRTENFRLLNGGLAQVNALHPVVPRGAFMYPLMIKNAAAVRKYLIGRKIFIPTLWPNVPGDTPPEWPDHRLAADVLPIPCDQRYGPAEMQYMIEEIHRGMEYAGREEAEQL